MIVYRHKKTGYIINRDIRAVAFRGEFGGDKSITLPNEIVEGSPDWERVLPQVLTYPAELVEPLFNCRMENVDTYIDRLMNYRDKIQNS